MLEGVTFFLVPFVSFTKPCPSSSFSWHFFSLGGLLCPWASAWHPLALGVLLQLRISTSPSPALKAVCAQSFFSICRVQLSMWTSGLSSSVCKTELTIFYINTIPTPGCFIFKIYSFFQSVTFQILDSSSPSLLTSCSVRKHILPILPLRCRSYFLFLFSCHLWLKPLSLVISHSKPGCGPGVSGCPLPACAFTRPSCWAAVKLGSSLAARLPLLRALLLPNSSTAWAFGVGLMGGRLDNNSSHNVWGALPTGSGLL